jgi:hypothetical protein
MRAPTGLLFGERIWVGVDVAELPTPTPPPTAIPLPGVTFTVDRDSIRAGECVTFAWDVSGGGQVYFHAEGQPWQLNGVAANGTRVECPNASMTYTLRINQADGSRLDLRPIRIVVTPAPSAPFITFFTVTPGFQIATGQCVEVRWQVEGEVVACAWPATIRRCGTARRSTVRRATARRWARRSTRSMSAGQGARPPGDKM